MDAKQLAKIREDYKVHPTVTHVYIPDLLDYIEELVGRVVAWEQWHQEAFPAEAEGS